ncbi:hypothetical protein ACIBL6_23025 [Streptomyces sp. NPDC050400]|uniref:hypothetical protein n=1 Tax=Streptomyces sp. NPDC050400 TaxID=3365610 RepID=UPI00379CF571
MSFSLSICRCVNVWMCGCTGPVVDRDTCDAYAHNTCAFNENWEAVFRSFLVPHHTDAPTPAGSIALRVKAEPFAVATTGRSVMYQPLGEDRPVVLSEGCKGDAIELTLTLKREPPREGCFTDL